jgi:CBS domain containing-hemolysin-like protein
LNAAGDRLAVGAPRDDGLGDAFTESGSVRLFTFSNTSFGGGDGVVTLDIAGLLEDDEAYSVLVQSDGSILVGGFAAEVFSRHGISGPALPLFSVGLTVLVILLGEILPKAIGSRLALPVALASAPAVGLIVRLMLPLVLLLERLLPAITAENEISTDEDEIRLLARLGSQKGQIEADEAAMIAKVFQLNDLTARDLMVPRVAAPTLDGDETLDAQRATLLRHSTAWWVVLGEEVDEVLGVASRERLLTLLLEGQGESKVAELVDAVEFVPEMIRADRLLTSFRRNGSGVRVVVDEFGGFVGVIGPEAVLAVLAGWWRRPLSLPEGAP